MPFMRSEFCPKCHERHGINVDFSTLGTFDCPVCGATDAIEIEWETEYDLDPIDDDE